MVKKKASDLKVNDHIILANEKLSIISTEMSDVSKQGSKKCRIEAKKASGEVVVIIRPADYPFEVV